jgi:PAS domain S-box-containing protein
MANDSALHASLQHAIQGAVAGHPAAFRWTGPAPDSLEFIGHASLAGKDRVLLILDQVSDQVESEEIFGVVREYLDSILNHLPIGVVVMNGDSRATFYNRSQAEIFDTIGLKLSMLDVIGARVDEFYPLFNRDEWQTFVEGVTERSEPVSRAKVPYSASGSTHYLQVEMLPLTAHQGHVSGVICLTQDVTRLVRLEEDLVRQERLAVAGQLVAKYHHEINNPLVSILGLAEMLLYKATLDEDVSRRVKRIRRGALRIAEVTKKMRELRELGKKEWPDRLPVLPDLSVRPGA